MDTNYWKGRKVFITGHTGFKGSWLSLYLQTLGAQVCGYSLPPSTNTSLYTEANIGDEIDSVFGDIRDFKKLSSAINEFQPSTIIHLAAQAIVSESYHSPLETYEINVMGTANLLESIRNLDSIEAAVIVTTDKCYENKEWVWSYRENEALGGNDPYSSSKACAELVTSSYRKSFFNGKNKKVAISTARAGNVLGGGDWAKDRLIPDLINSLSQNKCGIIRNPTAIRPWQHVLEPLTGYLLLAEKSADSNAYADSWNFGPTPNDCRPVSWVADQVTNMWSKHATWKSENIDSFKESHTLKLDSSKAHSLLGWQPKTELKDALKLTVEWFQAFNSGDSAKEITQKQIQTYIDKGTSDAR